MRDGNPRPVVLQVAWPACFRLPMRDGNILGPAQATIEQAVLDYL